MQLANVVDQTALQVAHHADANTLCINGILMVDAMYHRGVHSMLGNNKPWADLGIAISARRYTVARCLELAKQTFPTDKPEQHVHQYSIPKVCKDRIVVSKEFYEQVMCDPNFKQRLYADIQAAVWKHSKYNPERVKA